MLVAYGTVASCIAFWPHLPQRFGNVRVVIFRSLNLRMGVHNLYPRVLRLVIEKANLDKQAFREQTRDGDHRPTRTRDNRRVGRHWLPANRGAPLASCSPPQT